MTEQEAIQLHIAENIHRIEVIEDFLSTNSDANDKECRKNIDILTKINKALEEVQQYRAIGTVEECRAAVEKQTRIKVGRWKDGHACCSMCRRGVVKEDRYCCYCGQKLDWSEEE